MQVMIKIRLYKDLFTFCYLTEDVFLLPEERFYKYIGVRPGDYCDFEVDSRNNRSVKYVTTAYFLQPFIKECLKSAIYRTNVINNLNQIRGYHGDGDGTVLLKLNLKPPNREIIDYGWNERLLRLIWSRVEIENAFSWLSTLGGAYSALGDYFDYCAEEAGRISLRQYQLSRMLGDDGLAARSKLYSALAYAQKGNLKTSRRIVRNIAEFGRKIHDKRLVRMCHGVWAKLKYLRSLRKNTKKVDKMGDTSNGKVLST